MLQLTPAFVGDEETPRRLLLRWAGAAFSVAALHAGTAYAIMHWPRPSLPSGEPPAAVMIELAPVPMAPETPPQEVAVGEQAVMSDQSSPSEEKQEQPREPDKSEPKPEPPPEPKPEAETRPEPPPPTETPKLAEFPDAEAVLPAPAQEPPVETKPEEKPPEPEKPKEEEKEKSPPQQQSKKAAKATTAPKPIVAPKAKTNAAPTSGTASSMSMATWRGTVVAHLNRLKRAPGGSRGTATVAFSIDRRGNVQSARLARSSGIANLDREAVALVRRASPVPAPPANVKGSSVLLSVPVTISR